MVNQEFSDVVHALGPQDLRAGAITAKLGK